jgi:hypothetical protein
VLTFDFLLSTFDLKWALPAARAIRSYCTGLRHQASIRCYR